MYLQKEINLNKKFILIFILINVLALGLYYSYALFQVNVIKNNVIVINTGTIDLTVNVLNETNNTFSLTAGESKTVVVSLGTTNTGEIGYKLYYTNSGSTVSITSPDTFKDNIVQGSFTSSTAIGLIFTNTGSSSTSITIGGKGGLASYPISLATGQTAIPVVDTMTASEKILTKAQVRQNDGSSCQTYVEDYDDNDDLEATYISGSSDCINFNYVWWSGKMWRITAIYPDGSMKMVTDNNITSIAFYSNVYYYNKSTGAKSYMFQWLNEDFLDTLDNQGSDVIDYTKYWNATQPVNTNISTKPAETAATMIPTTTSPVGLLNSYEYWMSYKNLGTYNNSTAYGSGYLNIGYYWWLLNSRNASLHYYVLPGGGCSGNGSKITSGSRPSIYLKSDLALSGNGTKERPYHLSYDYNGANTNDLLYTRHSGEYIKFSSDGDNENYNTAPLYRIVGVEGEGNTRITKIVSMDYATYDNDGTPANTKQFASTTTFAATGNTESNDYWDYYLNNDWYDNLSFKNKIESGTYYIGTVGTTPNYKLAVCQTASSDTTATCLADSTKRVTTTFTGNVGLLRYGEMFATQQGSGSSSSASMWLITIFSSNSSTMRYLTNEARDADYNLGASVTSEYGARPSYYLKSSVKILSGTGLETDPYIVD